MHYLRRKMAFNVELKHIVLRLEDAIEEAKKEMNDHYDVNPYDGEEDIEGMRLEAELTGLQRAENIIWSVCKEEAD